jgi:acyl-CoA reductase-like NAD-dependent aldehyde dehydrogenase
VGTEGAKLDVTAKHKALSRSLYLDGAYAAGEGEAFPVINPATEEQIGEVTEATEREIDAAIGFAAAAQRKWWALSGAERADVMHEVTRATRAMGVPLAESLNRRAHRQGQESRRSDRTFQPLALRAWRQHLHQGPR